jgi:hypothetical protein
MARALLLKRPSPLVFPGVRAGFDPSHPAAKSAFLSAVPSGANFYNLLTGKKAAIVGSPTSGIDGSIGSYALPVSNTGYFQFSGLPTNTPAGFTFACIISSPSSWVNFTSLIQSSLAGVPQFYIDTGGNFGFYVSAGKSFFQAPATGGVPIFVAMSNDGSGSRCVMKNLRTGAITTATAGSDGSTAWGGTITIGGQAGGSGQGTPISAAMASSASLSMAQLQQWAQDPWLFWYPRSLDLSMMLSAGFGNSAALFGRTAVMSFGKLAAPAGAAPLGAKTIAAMKTTAAATAAMPLAGKTLAAAKSSSTPSSSAQMAARASIAARSTALFSGVAGLAGRAAAGLRIRASYGAPMIALVGAVMLQIKVAANSRGTAALSGRAAAAVKSPGTLAGLVGLAGRSAAGARARASAGFVAGLVGQTAARAKAGATAAGKVSLAAATRLAAVARLVPPGAIALVAAAFMRVVARAAPQGSATLQGRVQARAAAAGAAGGAVGLSGRLRVTAAARASASVVAGLAALAGRVAASLSLRGIIGLVGGLFVASPRIASPAGENRTVTPVESPRIVIVSAEGRSGEPKGP